jgi:trigger factor
LEAEDFAMAEDQAAVQEQQETPYQIKVEDAGPATKKISVEISQEIIAAKLEENFKQLRRDAAVPGFRPGHAPQKLIEKRFNSDVREQVRRSLIGESYEQAVKKNSLQVIGEPEFDKADDITLPDTGNLNYSFQVEVQPDIILPTLTGLTVKRPKVEVADDHIDQALQNLRRQRGALVPVEDRGVESGDNLIADVHLKVDDKIVSHEHDAQIVARPARLSGLRVEDFDERLKGMKPGEKREFTVKGSATEANEALRGKDVAVEIDPRARRGK